MTGRSHGAGSAVPKLSHAEAEGLVSARLDAPLESAQAQMLAVHLRDCPKCRQFADQMESMRTGFRSLPHLPASPIVSRQVRERISQPASIGERIGGLFGSGSALGPMAASAALIALVIASYALFASINDNGAPSTITANPAGAATATPRENTYAATSADQNGVTPGSLITPSVAIIDVRGDTPTATSDNQLVAEPTETARATATEKPLATATDKPTEEPTDIPTETATPRPTKTATAEPTNTREPSATPEPTRTPTDEPTATKEPSNTPTDEPTATDKPTETPTDEPTATREPTETPTDEPTATDEPTETPTDEPTATDEPTETPTDEPTKTEEPTSTPIDEPTEAVAPTIEPIDSTEPVDEPTVAESVNQDEPTDEAEADETSNIEPMNTPDAKHGPEDDPGDSSGSAEADGAALDNADHITGLPGNVGAPTGPLRVNATLNWTVLSSDPSGGELLVASMLDGTIVANLGAAANPIWSPLGLVLLYQDYANGTPAAAIFDAELGTLRRISDPDAVGAIQDVPAGWSGEWAYYLRQFSDGSISLLARNVNTDEEILVWEGAAYTMGGARPIPTSRGFLIPTSSEWLLVGTDGTEQSLGPNEYGISGEGFLSPYETLVAYPAGGQLIIASSEQPGVPIALIPYSGGMGSGFSWRPDGEYLVVSDGSRLDVYTYDGQSAGAATSSSGAQIAAPQWLDDGIYYVEVSPNASLRRLNSESVSGSDQ